MAIRSAVLLSVLTLAGCTRIGTSSSPDLPASVSPGWRLASVHDLAPGAAPDLVRQAHPKRAWIAEYTGPSTAHVRVWDLPGVAGLDLVQRWKPEPNTVVFYSPRYFAAVDWGAANRVDAGALVRAVERAIGVSGRQP